MSAEAFATEIGKARQRRRAVAHSVAATTQGEPCTSSLREPSPSDQSARSFGLSAAAMAAQAQKPRRRIVPQLITSPSSQDRDADALLTAEQPQAAPPPAVDQREQSEWARENLGPDRKVFLDLSALSNTEIDWKQVRTRRRRAGASRRVRGAQPPVRLQPFAQLPCATHMPADLQGARCAEDQESCNSAEWRGGK